MSAAAVSLGSRYRYANGRRHVNRLKKLRQRIRRGQILAAYRRGEIDVDLCGGRIGAQRTLAVRFGVNERTIRRDLKAILSASPTCPLCGQEVPAKAPKTVPQ